MLLTDEIGIGNSVVLRGFGQELDENRYATAFALDCKAVILHLRRSGRIRRGNVEAKEDGLSVMSIFSKK